MIVIIWRFLPAPGREAEFRDAYGEHGAWARLFARGDGFAGVELLAASDGSGEYLTLDRWRTRAAFEAFKREFAQDYADLDHTCAQLTVRESHLGWFERD